MHTLPELPYALDALWPYMSPETLRYHYGKHHHGYVDKLNELIQGTKYEKMSLTEVIIESKKNKDEEIHNQSAQIWNHNFFWKSLSAGGTRSPKENVMFLMKEHWGDFQHFKEEFNKKAAENFGSGWTWLCLNKRGLLEISNTTNEGNFVGTDNHPLLVVDVWEHAYYIDYKNMRTDYLKAFWNIVNWNFASENLEAAMPRR